MVTHHFTCLSTPYSGPSALCFPNLLRYLRFLLSPSPSSVSSLYLTGSWVPISCSPVKWCRMNIFWKCSDLRLMSSDTIGFPALPGLWKDVTRLISWRFSLAMCCLSSTQPFSCIFWFNSHVNHLLSSWACPAFLYPTSATHFWGHPPDLVTNPTPLESKL